MLTAMTSFLKMAIGGKGIDLDKVQVHPTGLVDPKEPDVSG